MPAIPCAPPKYSLSCQAYISGDEMWFSSAYFFPDVNIAATTYNVRLGVSLRTESVLFPKHVKKTILRHISNIEITINVHYGGFH